MMFFDQSRRITISLAAIAICAATASLAADSRTSVSIPAAAVQFGATGIKTSAGELKAGPAYGDLAKGKHGTFIRMPAGYSSPIHTHTEDYFGVVISGTGANSKDGNSDIKLTPGSYWFQRGKEPHITKCLSETECLFFIYQPGKFDYVLAK